MHAKYLACADLKKIKLRGRGGGGGGGVEAIELGAIQ